MADEIFSIDTSEGGEPAADPPAWPIPRELALRIRQAEGWLRLLAVVAARCGGGEMGIQEWLLAAGRVLARRMSWRLRPSEALGLLRRALEHPNVGSALAAWLAKEGASSPSLDELAKTAFCIEGAARSLFLLGRAFPKARSDVPPPLAAECPLSRFVAEGASDWATSFVETLEAGAARGLAFEDVVWERIAPPN